MKTRILPLVISSILAGGMTAVKADVRIFGHIDTSIDAVDVDGSDIVDAPADGGRDHIGYDDINLNCTTCSIGFKGSENLGNGLKAIFKLDFQFDTINRNKGSITDRDQWIGLKGNFGQVRVGTISTGYKSHGAMIDPLYRTALQGRGGGLQSDFHNGAGEELQGRADNTIRYDSPSFNGLKAVAHYTLDSDESGEDEDPFGIGASYENDGILVFADYLDNQQDDTDEKTAWKVGGKYNLGMFGLMGQYEDAEVGDADQTVWHLGGTASLMGATLYLGYGKGEHDYTGGEDEYTAWTLAAMYGMSKRTSLYMGFTQADCDRDAGYAFSACEVDNDTNADGEVDQFSLGLKHKF